MTYGLMLHNKQFNDEFNEDKNLLPYLNLNLMKKYSDGKDIPRPERISFRNID